MGLKVCDAAGGVVVDMGGQDAPTMVEQLTRQEPLDGHVKRQVFNAMLAAVASGHCDMSHLENDAKQLMKAASVIMGQPVSCSLMTGSQSSPGEMQ